MLCCAKKWQLGSSLSCIQSRRVRISRGWKCLCKCLCKCLWKCLCVWLGVSSGSFFKCSVAGFWLLDFFLHSSSFLFIPFLSADLQPVSIFHVRQNSTFRTSAWLTLFNLSILWSHQLALGYDPDSTATTFNLPERELQRPVMASHCSRIFVASSMSRSISSHCPDTAAALPSALKATKSGSKCLELGIWHFFFVACVWMGQHAMKWYEMAMSIGKMN